MFKEFKLLLNDSRIKRALVLMNLLAVCFVVFYRVNFIDWSSTDLFLLSNDARAYLKVANWFVHPYEFLDHLMARQFFYPLVVLMTKSIGGFGLTVFVQVLFWLGALNMIALTVVKITQRLWLGMLAGFLFMSHFGMIALLFHGLTETLTVFLLTLLSSYLLTLRKSDRPRLMTLYSVMFLLSLLVATKAMFSVVWMVALIVLPLFYFQQILKKPKAMLFLVLALMPALLQLGIMKVHFNSWTFSKVGGKTLTNYLYVQGLTGIMDLERAELIEYAESQSADEKMAYVMANKTRYIDHFFENVYGNIRSTSYLIPDNGRFVSSDTFRKLTGIQNRMVFVIHVLGLVLLVFLVVMKRLYLFNPDQIAYVLLWLLLLFIVLVSGISYWQGDRLTIPALPIAFTLYPILGWMLIARTKS